MQILKSQIEVLLRELPDKVDIDDVMYRIYLLKKIEAGETDINEGKMLSHKDAIKRLSKKWRN